MKLKLNLVKKLIYKGKLQRGGGISITDNQKPYNIYYI